MVISFGCYTVTPHVVPTHFDNVILPARKSFCIRLLHNIIMYIQKLLHYCGFIPQAKVLVLQICLRFAKSFAALNTSMSKPVPNCTSAWFYLSRFTVTNSIILTTFLSVLASTQEEYKISMTAFILTQWPCPTTIHGNSKRIKFNFHNLPISDRVGVATREVVTARIQKVHPDITLAQITRWLNLTSSCASKFK